MVLNTSLIRRAPGSVGEIVSNTLAKVVPADNPDGESLGPNHSGELLLKGPQVMKGYHNNPEETAKTFVDGWLRTGDMVFYDENELFYVTDRLKELIKVRSLKNILSIQLCFVKSIFFLPYSIQLSFPVRFNNDQL